MTSSASTSLGRCCICLSPSVTSFHFGVKSCKPCAAFFRRTVSLNVEHKCIGKGNCVIHYEKRVMCKSCRFEKCLKNNMNPLFVRSRMAVVASSSTEVNNTPEQTPTPAEQRTGLSDEDLQRTILHYTKMESDLNIRRKVLHTSLKLSDVFDTECETPFSIDNIREYNYNLDSFRACVTVQLDYIKAFPEFEKFSLEEKELFYRYTGMLDYVLNSAYYSMRIGVEHQLSVLTDGSYVRMNPKPPSLEEARAAGKTFTEEEANYYRTVIPSITNLWTTTVIPFSKLKMSFREFVLFKALVCWHIGSTKFSLETRKICDQSKNILFEAMLSVISKSDVSPEQRLGEILLFMSCILEVLHSQLNDVVMIATFNFVGYDPLLTEICNYRKW